MILCLSITPMYAVIYYVSPNGDNANGGMNWDTAWSSISHAASNTYRGDTVIVSNGLYNEQITLISNGTANSNIIFKALNKNQAVINGSGNNYCFYLTNISHVQINGFFLKQADDSGIYVQGTSGSNYFLNNLICSNHNGIYINSEEADYNYILTNTIYSQNNAILIADSDYNQIRQNKIKGNNYAIRLTGINASACEHNYLIKNSIYSNSHGISLYTIFAYIYTNYIYANDNNGIYIANANNCQIKSNQIYKNEDGIIFNYGSSHKIENNLIYSNTDRGIYLQYITSLFYYNIIIANDIFGNRQGISAGTTVYYLYLDNNKIHHNQKGVFFGVLSLQDPGERFYIRGNIIYSNIHYGILIGDDVENVNILSNTIYGPTQTNGIVLTANRQVKVFNNTIYNNYKNGIYINSENSDNHLIKYNSIFGPDQPVGLNLSLGDSATVFSNRIYDHTDSGILIDNSLNNKIFRNLICNNNNYGIQINNSSSGISIIHNTIYNSKTEDGILWTNNSSGTMYNNIVMSNGDDPANDHGIENSGTGTVYAAFNCLYGNAGGPTNGNIIQAKNFYLDPEIQTFDLFQIISGYSPVVDKATNIPEASGLFSNEAPDIGWYEYIFNDSTKPFVKINRSDTTYVGKIEVIITASDAQCGIEYICYTLDNSDPKSSATRVIKYTDQVSIFLDKPTTLKCYTANQQKIFSHTLTKTFEVLRSPAKNVMVYNNRIKADSAEPARIVFGKSGQARIHIYNLKGMLIREYPQQYYEQGSIVTWDGSYQNNTSINSGIYIVLVSGDINEKMIVVVERD